MSSFVEGSCKAKKELVGIASALCQLRLPARRCGSFKKRIILTHMQSFVRMPCAQLEDKLPKHTTSFASEKGTSSSATEVVYSFTLHHCNFEA